MSAVIAVACKHFGTGFGAVLTSLLRSEGQLGETMVECRTDDAGADLSCPNLREFMRRAPGFSALIGISIRPGADAVADLRARGIPVVLIDEEVEGATTVACDNVAGGMIAAQHLIACGRRTLAVVCGKRSLEGGYSASLRVKGFHQALSTAGLALAEGNVLEVARYTRDEGVQTMLKVIDGARTVDGIFCAAGDLCATGMLSAARRRQVRIPEQLALIGFDDHPMSGIADPPLTTIRQPLERIAAEALRLATREAEAICARPRRIVFPPELVRRRSTLPV